MLALCWHNMPAHNALNYAGIFAGRLVYSYYNFLNTVTPNDYYENLHMHVAIQINSYEQYWSNHSSCCHMLYK